MSCLGIHFVVVVVRAEVMGQIFEKPVSEPDANGLRAFKELGVFSLSCPVLSLSLSLSFCLSLCLSLSLYLFLCLFLCLSLSV